MFSASKRLILGAVVIFIIIAVAFLFFFLKKPKVSDFLAVNYKGTNIPYGYASVSELGKTMYTGIVKNLVIPGSGKATITLVTLKDRKTFSFDPALTLVAVNAPKDEGVVTIEGKEIPALGTVEWKVLPKDEIQKALSNGTIVSVQFSKSDLSKLPTPAEIEAQSPDISTSILVHSYL